MQRDRQMCTWEFNICSMTSSNLNIRHHIHPNKKLQILTLSRDRPLIQWYVLLQGLLDLHSNPLFLPGQLWLLPTPISFCPVNNIDLITKKEKNKRMFRPLVNCLCVFVDLFLWLRTDHPHGGPSTFLPPPHPPKMLRIKCILMKCQMLHALILSKL